MQYTPADIAQVCKGKLVTNTAKAKLAPVTALFFDTRNISLPDGGLFVAVHSASNDGHRFITDAYQKGIRYFLVERVGAKEHKLPGGIFIVVSDSLKALQTLAAYHRSLFSIPVVGITGSNGKTIVKEWLYQLTAPDKLVVRSPKSYNSQLGVPLSVWQMNDKHELGIFEAGISKPNEMAVLAEVIKPPVVIFTNIGEAHSENFVSKEEKTFEKLQLAKSAEKLVFCNDNKLVAKAIEKSGFKKKQLFSWGRKKGDVIVTKINKGKENTTIHYLFKNDTHHFTIPFVDDASVENAMHALCGTLVLGFKPHEINKRMAYLTPVAMRLELKQGINNCTIINDSYNSDLESLSIALNFLSRQKQQPKNTVILSDIEQSGLSGKELYARVAGMLKEHTINRFIGVGIAIAKYKKLFDKHAEFYSSTDEFLAQFTPYQFANETVLLKGSRRFEFERIGQLLQQKSHQTVLEINLNAAVNNLNYFRSLLKPETKVMAMVKAFSYGSGSFEIANALQHHKIDYLAVAYADEGVELRRNGITVPIMVMNPEYQSFGAIVEHKLEPIIYSFSLLDEFSDYLALSHKKIKSFPIHIELETGMKRLGFEQGDIIKLVKKIKEDKSVKVVSCFSHLASADEKKDDTFTNAQIDLFEKLTTKLAAGIGYHFMRHILNSAGIYRFAKAQYNMVRLGIGLYGVGVDNTEQQKLQTVSRLKSIVSQVKQVKKAETIGYNRKGVAKTNITIATIPIGYADGVSRALSNGKGRFWVNGKLCPIIGNVCMDMTMINITGVDVREGDEVEIFGDNYTIFQLADDLHTIPYEVLTNVSGRVKRVYYQE